MSTLLISTHLYEKRPLKKSKLGPPDVYPQDPKQKEDELTPTNVKQGYSNTLYLQDEWGTARGANITSVRFGEYFSAILAKKHEINTFNDTSKKKHVVNKDSALFVTAKTKNYVEGWFKDLSSNIKSLAHLSKKVPFFNKKEEIFVMLYEYSIPMLKAQWFIKLSNAHHVAMSESNNKSKKRQMPDPSQEWTMSLCKFLKEHYHKIAECINPSCPNNSSSNTSANNSFSAMNTIMNQPSSNSNKHKELLDQWSYYTMLAKSLFEEGLLDRHDFLTWLLEMFEKIKSIEDPMLSLISTLLVNYVDEFAQSEFLSRHLAFNCAKRISQLVECGYEFSLLQENDKENSVKETVNSSLNSKSSSSNLNLNDPENASRLLSTCFKEIISCSKYQELLFSFSTIMQVITLECPTALVWHNNENGPLFDSNLSSKTNLFQGSPLDYLPCEPSNLPILYNDNVEEFRNKLRRSENLIRYRSSNSEKKWFYRTFEAVSSNQSIGNVVNRLLDVLDSLDKHLFDKIAPTNSLETLYHKIFSTCIHHHHPNHHHHHHHHHGCHEQETKTSVSSHQNNATHKKSLAFGHRTITEIVSDDTSVVKLLCEWAVTTKRLGEFRSRIVAKLLEKRQNEIKNEVENACSDDLNKSTESEELKMTNIGEEKPSSETFNCNTETSKQLNSSKYVSQYEAESPPIYQKILFEYLDSFAPVTEDKNLNISLSNTHNRTTDNKQAFNNLVLLFTELIRYDVFSHNLYMCTLISSGHFINPISSVLSSNNNPNHGIKNVSDDSLTKLLPQSMDSMSNGSLLNPINKSTSSSSLPMFDPLSNHSNLNNNEQLGSNMFLMNDTLDEDKLDEDLDKLLQNIKAGQQSKDDQNDIFLPDAMESDKEEETIQTNSVHHSSELNNGGTRSQSNESINQSTRHLLYTYHFPLPQEDFVHECNQRHILLYGVGKTKDEPRHVLKKFTKEIQKLFSRKSSMDISDNGKVKKHAIKEGFNFENAIAKFQNLSIFDQHMVTNSCATIVLEMLNGVVIGNANHLPLIESIAFLFDLMEIALNVNGLVEFIVRMLKELVEVEIVLQQKCSILARPYCTSIGLYIVGVLNRYHSYVLACSDDIVQIFDGLLKLVRHASIPNDCSSAERCIFFYIDDLYSSCSCLLKKYQDITSPLTSKIKSMISIRDDIAICSFSTSCIMMQYLKNPREKVDSIHIKQLNEIASDRYSLVFNAIRCIAEANDMDYLNELSVLCAELTASCWLLSSEWYNAFQALCDPKCKNEYTALLAQINIGDGAIYDNLAVFVTILVARRCFGLEELIYRVFIPSLLIPTVEFGNETEQKARLCCHLILYLFKYYDSPLAASNSAVNSSFASSFRYSLTSPGPLSLSNVPPTLNSGQKSFVIKYACDRYLLGGALNSLRLELILTLLKAIFVLGTQDKKGGKLDFENNLYKSIGEDDYGDRNYLSLISKTKSETDKPTLADFAKYVLQQVCHQDWIHDRCLRGFLVHPNAGKLLLDKKISYKDSQCLLNMICYNKQILPSSSSSSQSSSSSSIVNFGDKFDGKQIFNIFQNLDEWSLRISWLQLNLIYENLVNNSQSNSSAEIINWIETLASAIVDYFHKSCQSEIILDSQQSTMFTAKSSTLKTSLVNSLNYGNGHLSVHHSSERIWLLKPLISKLPTLLQNKILRVTASLFESYNWINYSQTSSGSMSSKSKSGFQGFKNTNNAGGISLNAQNPTSTLLSNQPFVSLLLMCLNSKEDHKELILKSIYSQLSQCINEKLSDDIKSKNAIQEGLQLRLSLLGTVFDSIKSSTSLTNDWVVLLAQLISYTIVDPQINFVNFTTVLDMLASLMHHSHASNMLLEQREETRKLNQNLIKKLKKELNVERVGPGVLMARQLLPLVKHQAEVIACEAMGSLVDTKGNKIAGFDSIDKKQGFQAAEKHKISPWDLIEGHKNSAPLSWTWFGAIKMERKPLRMEENFSLLARHNHNISKPISFYVESPPIPPEDEPVVATPQTPTPSMTSLPQNIMQPLGYHNNSINSSGTNLPMQGPSTHINQPNANFTNQNNIRPLHPTPPLSGASMTPGGFQYHHLSPMSINTNNMQHTLQPSPVCNTNPIMHSPAMVSQTQQHIMNSTPEPHLNSNHSMMMNSMPMEMMDISTGQPGPMNPAMPNGNMANLRPSMPATNTIPIPPMPTISTRAQTPKKPKTTRKRRATKNQTATNNVSPLSTGQPTQPIRMPANSFDNYNQNSVNSQNANNWQYQSTPNNPSQANMNSNNQQFYHHQHNNSNGLTSNPSIMMPQQPRFPEQMMQQNTSKVRLRAMLNTRHPNTSQFQMNQNETNALHQNPIVNPMMNNSQAGQSMISNSMFTARHSIPQMMQKAPIRSQQPQQNSSIVTNQSQMFAQQQMSSQNSGQIHHQHHMSHQQSSNFNQSNVSYNDQIQSIDNSVQLASNNNFQSTNVSAQQQQQNTQGNLMMRPQLMQQQADQNQFIAQRSQFSNFGGHQQQQSSQQPMMNNSQSQHWNGVATGPSNQMGHQRPMTQLQQQLSATSQIQPESHGTYTY
ncbi:Mediator of RNA polymerase II transcription subunit 12-like protein [Sarcoptes scabiei]|uniref:Mediator of RNA polymerase II transcription subunit 12-like protein n=1 Tax=Sarcoptes scabiei TaxID=52283 RepID=A0A834R5V9_SARSC|nr:Mediator of RNA polymerase II transcription subunit 12-like protein [Sarcoptes scabiei]